ncbi:MAG: rRNA (cytidine-2'-O-)-methyltransferase, partial [Chthonomonas sp.]|nr:rRNA (cytidine-2'-O-)-methyltransferase [Chthonomonas sp.]
MVATPLGNLGDLSPRAAEALRDADRWFVEDTRVSGKLATHLGVKKSMTTVNEHTTLDRIESLVAGLGESETVALLSDAGSPVVSDPGTLVVDCAVRQGLIIEAVPGPSAPIL